MNYYLFVCMDNIKDAVSGLGGFLVIVSAVTLTISSAIILSDASGEDTVAKAKKAANRAAWAMSIGVFILIISNLIPSTKQLAAIYLLPKIVENRQITELPDKAVTLANEWLEELRPKK